MLQYIGVMDMTFNHKYYIVKLIIVSGIHICYTCLIPLMMSWLLVGLLAHSLISIFF